jgi:flavodoxin
MITKIYYHSKNGNTERVATAMATAAGTQAINIASNKALEHADLLFVGDGIYGGKVDPATLEFIAGLDKEKVKQAAIFCTYGLSHKGVEQLRTALAEKGIPVLEEFFCCKGKMGILNGKHPTDSELSNAVLFADRAIRQSKDAVK